MKFSKIMSVINIFLLAILVHISTPFANNNIYFNVLLFVTFMGTMIVSIVLLFKKDSKIVERHYVPEITIEGYMENYDIAKSRLSEYVLKNFNNILLNDNSVADVFAAGYHCNPTNKPLEEYAKDYLTKIKK